MFHVLISIVFLVGLITLNDFAMRYYVEHRPKKPDSEGNWKPVLDWSVLIQWVGIVFIVGWLIGVTMALSDWF